MKVVLSAKIIVPHPDAACISAYMNLRFQIARLSLILRDGTH